MVLFTNAIFQWQELFVIKCGYHKNYCTKWRQTWCAFTSLNLFLGQVLLFEVDNYLIDGQIIANISANYHISAMNIQFLQFYSWTRMHSSRMRTVRSSSRLCSWGVPDPGELLQGGACSRGGCLLQGEGGGTWSRGGPALGDCLLRRGACSRGGCLLQGGTCSRGVVPAPGGCLLREGWYPSMHWGRPPLWTQWQTGVKHNLCNFVADGKYDS